MADDADPTSGQVTVSTMDLRSDLEGPESDDDNVAPDAPADGPVKTPVSVQRVALAVGLVLVAALAGLTSWLGIRAYQSHQAEQARNLFLQVGRQGAINLTTIDWQNVDGDVQRILDSATGSFYDDFSKRSQPFKDVVVQAQSSSVGDVTGAGLESDTGNEAQVLVAVTVKTSNAAAPQQDPRSWRMRILVQKIGDEAKVANVEFVP